MDKTRTTVSSQTNTIKESVKSFLAEVFFLDSETITLENDTSFFASGIIDSTGSMEIISYLEEVYGIQILDSETIPENLDSLNNIERFVLSKLRSSGI